MVPGWTVKKKGQKKAVVIKHKEKRDYLAEKGLFLDLIV